MHYTSLFVEVLQRLRHLRYNMTRQLFAEICETDDLVEELATGT